MCINAVQSSFRMTATAIEFAPIMFVVVRHISLLTGETRAREGLYGLDMLECDCAAGGGGGAKAN